MCKVDRRPLDACAAGDVGSQWPAAFTADGNAKPNRSFKCGQAVKVMLCSVLVEAAAYYAARAGLHVRMIYFNRRRTYHAWPCLYYNGTSGYHCTSRDVVHAAAMVPCKPWLLIYNQQHAEANHLHPL